MKVGWAGLKWAGFPRNMRDRLIFFLNSMDNWKMVSIKKIMKPRFADPQSQEEKCDRFQGMSAHRSKTGISIFLILAQAREHHTAGLRT